MERICPCGKPAVKRASNSGGRPKFCEEHMKLSRFEKRKLDGSYDANNEKVRKPCRRCGGPKEAGAHRQLCDKCRAKPLRYKVCAGCGGPKPRRQGVRFCDSCRPAPAPRKRVVKATPKPVRVRPEPKRVPSEVRAAWRNAHKNSIIRQKYPDTRALELAAQRGEFEQVAA